VLVGVCVALPVCIGSLEQGTLAEARGPQHDCACDVPRTRPDRPGKKVKSSKLSEQCEEVITDPQKARGF
jgi:hypothetical protein